MSYYYIEKIESEKRDILVFDSQDDRNEWELLNKSPCQIIDEGDFNDWVKERRFTNKDLLNLKKVNFLEEERSKLKKKIDEIDKELSELKYGI